MFNIIETLEVIFEGLMGSNEISPSHYSILHTKTQLTGSDLREYDRSFENNNPISFY